MFLHIRKQAEVSQVLTNPSSIMFARFSTE